MFDTMTRDYFQEVNAERQRDVRQVKLIRDAMRLEAQDRAATETARPARRPMFAMPRWVRSLTLSRT